MQLGVMAVLHRASRSEMTLTQANREKTKVKLSAPSPAPTRLAKTAAPNCMTLSPVRWPEQGKVRRLDDGTVDVLPEQRGTDARTPRPCRRVDHSIVSPDALSTQSRRRMPCNSGLVALCPLSLYLGRRPPGAASTRTPLSRSDAGASANL